MLGIANHDQSMMAWKQRLLQQKSLERENDQKESLAPGGPSKPTLQASKEPTTTKEQPI
jgi:hypothetical protein